MATTKFDYLIIGQGLAGSILAHQLITQGQRVMVFDNDHIGSSSTVAAGIINPITGPRLSCAENFVERYEVAKAYYAKLEYHIKQNVFDEIKQLRQIQNDEQAHFLNKRLNSSTQSNLNYKAFIKQSSNTQDSPFKQKDYPLINIRGTAIVDTKALLEATKVWLSSLYSYQKLAVHYENFNFDENSVHYQEFSASKVIFCEGYQAINNPWLRHLPFKLAKGEILTLSNSAQLQTMLSWDKWLVPHHASLKLGSNFDWENLELAPSKSVKQSLIESMTKHTNLNANVIKHEVGIRPSTRQREPFIGALPSLNNAYCFNGFGSKGCLLIPDYAELFCNHLLQNKPLPTKVTQWL